MSFKINGYPIDVQVRFEGRHESTVSKFPVEKSVDYSDNIRRTPRQIDVEGVVTDTPIGAMAIDPSRTALQGKTLPTTDAYKRMVAIWLAGQPVTVETTRDTYKNMAMTQFSDPIDPGQGNALMFTATFEELNIVENQRTTVATIQHQSLGAREALLAYLGKNTVWVTSKKRESDGAVQTPDPSQPGRFTFSSSAHKPVKDPVYGSPILSTTHLDRITTNNYDIFGEVWVDHYKLLPGNQESDNSMLWADGYVLLADTGASPVAGIKQNVKKGYYILNGNYPHVQQELDAPSQPVGDFGSGVLKDSQGRSLTQRPPGTSAWDDILNNNGTK